MKMLNLVLNNLFIFCVKSDIKYYFIGVKYINKFLFDSENILLFFFDLFLFHFFELY